MSGLGQTFLESSYGIGFCMVGTIHVTSRAVGCILINFPLPCHVYIPLATDECDSN